MLIVPIGAFVGKVRLVQNNTPSARINGIWLVINQVVLDTDSMVYYSQCLNQGVQEYDSMLNCTIG